MGQKAEEKKYRDSNGSRQNNKRKDSQVESNDNPQIPHGGRRQTSLVFFRELFWANTVLVDRTI